MLLIVPFNALAAVAIKFLHQPGFVKQLIAFQHALLVPALAETDIDAFAPQFGGFAVRRVLHEFLESGQNSAFDHHGLLIAPVLPWKIMVPASPLGTRRVRYFA